MQAKFLALFALTSIASVWASPLEAGTICKGQVKVSEEYIGKDHNVKVEHVTCPDAVSLEPSSFQPPTSLEARQATVNVCGAPCTTNCFLPAGGGPDPNDCHVITDALKFASENTGPTFTVGTGASLVPYNNTVIMSYLSCKTFFLNQDVNFLSYCRNDWASLVDFVAFNCQSTQNAHGGNCVAADQRWFVQVQHT
ncbi:hypothetical protein BDZ94DRAFT_1302121 [Collybia nuda]|uniref:Uncharacterized protein n=1 Tax=Collybia nuda TaxID=64659 RepID=A0A9P5XUT8_9AGAR|nr:hypothetical protein BDZ94DRAFT_1302121 [Collybia nuda]